MRRYAWVVAPGRVDGDMDDESKPDLRRMRIPLLAGASVVVVVLIGVIAAAWSGSAQQELTSSTTAQPTSAATSSQELRQRQAESVAKEASGPRQGSPVASGSALGATWRMYQEDGVGGQCVALVIQATTARWCSSPAEIRSRRALLGTLNVPGASSGSIASPPLAGTIFYGKLESGVDRVRIEFASGSAVGDVYRTTAGYDLYLVEVKQILVDQEDVSAVVALDGQGHEKWREAPNRPSQAP